MPRLACAAVVSLALLADPAFGQGDPIMPLDEVQRGMQCEGRSVFRGTQVETFNVEVLDVIAANAGAPASILFRAYGPLVDGTGLGFGFSGSPIYCPGSDGVSRNIGAVAMSVEDYGNDVALATPIESMLDRPVSEPGSARPATAAERRARPLVSPLMVSGLGSVVRGRLTAAAARHGIRVLAAPATAAQVATGTDLVPGSAVAASLSSGSVGLNGIGTVTYRDGDRIWAFGHPFEDVGTRSLLMQGAFVHTVVGNPNPAGFTGLGTYKLASAGDIAGVVDFDGQSAISGLLGPPPTLIAVDVYAQDEGGERVQASESLVADESALDHPSGFPSLSFITSIAVSDQAIAALRSSAGAAYGRMCTNIELAERNKPLRFCNRYAGIGAVPGGVQFGMGNDASSAAALVESFDRSLLHVERVRTSLTLTEGNRFATLRGASGPRRARPGEKIRVRLRIQRSRQRVERASFELRVPRNLAPGRRTLRLSGTAADGADDFFDIFFIDSFSDEDFSDPFEGDGDSPATVKQLAKRVAAIHRYDGIRATFRRQRRDDKQAQELGSLFGNGDSAAAGRRVFRHPELRIGGSAKLRLRITGR